MKWRHVTAILLALVVVPALSVFGRSSGASSASIPHVRPGTLLTNTTFGASTQLDQVDMLSPALGYALASQSLGHDRYRYYLVRTTNLARTWTVRGEIPSDDERYPIFSDFSTVDSDPFLYFVNRDVGYVDGPSGSIYVTSDAGLTWSEVADRDSSSSYGVVGSAASIVTTTCRTPHGSKTLLCHSRLNEYVAGTTRPERSSLIPDTRRDFRWDAALLAVAPDSTEIVNLDSDNLSTPTSLIISHDDGRSWVPLSNPCAQLMIEQLIVASDGQWLLSCFLDGGMYHGTAKIFRSIDGGVSWSTVVDDTAQRNIVGNLGGTPAYLFFNADDSTLYAAMMNPAGGLMTSTDGGTTWRADRVLGYTSGSPGSVSNYGPTSSIYQVFQGPMYVTDNSRTWHLLPPLPAGRYRGLSICTKQRVKVSLRHVKSGGLRYTYVDFTNTSDTRCYLDGTPTARLLSADSSYVGPPVTAVNNPIGNGFVTLAAHGGVASVALLINPTSTYQPPSTCRAKVADTIRLSFDSPSSFTLPLGSRRLSTCTVMANVGVANVRAGPGRP
jgi:hypothetical protein